MNTTMQEQIAAPGKVWQIGLLAAAIASVGNLIVYAIASALGVTFNITPPNIPAPPFAMAVVFATVFGVLAGTLLFTLMPRFSQRPVTTWRIIAIVVLVLSLAQPLLLLGTFMTPEPAAIGTVLALELMHIVAGVVTIVLLTSRARA
ncbi:MAG: hypothetical protein H7Y11_05085 [Armatimonadetes bacterium]|nr:hypothetical protein [Anaerolineae bacterium]